MKKYKKNVGTVEARVRELKNRSLECKVKPRKEENGLYHYYIICYIISLL